MQVQLLHYLEERIDRFIASLFLWEISLGQDICTKFSNFIAGNLSDYAILTILRGQTDFSHTWTNLKICELFGLINHEKEALQRLQEQTNIHRSLSKVTIVPKGFDNTCNPIYEGLQVYSLKEQLTFHNCASGSKSEIGFMCQ